MPSRLQVRGTAALFFAFLLVLPLVLGQGRDRPVARVEIDGHPWVESDGGFLVLDLKPGRHQVHVSHSGYRVATTELEVRAATTIPLNVTLVPDRRDR